MTITIFPQDFGDLVEREGPSRPPPCGVEHILERRLIGLFDEQLQEIFLKGLMCRSCSLP
jgi:hypothetical protein